MASAFLLSRRAAAAAQARGTDLSLRVAFSWHLRGCEPVLARPQAAPALAAQRFASSRRPVQQWALPSSSQRR